MLPILQEGKRRRGHRLPVLLGSAVLVIGVVATVLVVLSSARSSSGDDRASVPDQLSKPTKVERHSDSRWLVDDELGDHKVIPKFRKPPRAGMLFDVKTGEVLWQRNPHRKLRVASLTKLMTSLIVVERTSRSRWINCCTSSAS